MIAAQGGVSSPLGLAISAGGSADLSAAQDLGFPALFIGLVVLLQYRVGLRKYHYLAGVCEPGKRWE